MESNQISGALNVAISAVLEAGKQVTQNISHLDKINVTEVDKRLVSDIDIRNDEIIIEMLDAAYPEFNIISRESGDKQRKSNFCWLIDPLEATDNFLHGHPHCAITIALRYNENGCEHALEDLDEIVCAVVYDPLRNELFSASKGKNSQQDGRRIRVSDQRRLNASFVATTYPARKSTSTKTWLKSFAATLPRAQKILQTGCTSLDLAYVAAGRYEGFWQYDLDYLNIAAGSLIVRQAGGTISNPKSKKSESEESCLVTGNVVCGNNAVHEKLAHILSEI